MSGRIALYPGCSLEGSSSAFARSLGAVAGRLGLELTELGEWNCCGATSAHALDQRLHLALNLRNLALAEAQGFTEVVAPCAACFHRLAGANQELRSDARNLARLNEETGSEYEGRVVVRNVLDLLANEVGAEAIAAQVERPLRGMRVACYYGCLNTRLPGVASFDDREYPMTMDRIVKALGGEAVEWGYKTECCGAGLAITREATSAGLVAAILRDAEARGADCLAVACPMCQTNLDLKQRRIREEFGIGRPLPILFITQIMGLAFGMGEAELGLKQNFVPAGELMKPCAPAGRDGQ